MHLGPWLAVATPQVLDRRVRVNYRAIRALNGDGESADRKVVRRAVNGHDRATCRIEHVVDSQFAHRASAYWTTRLFGRAACTSRLATMSFHLHAAIELVNQALEEPAQTGRAAEIELALTALDIIRYRN